MPARINELVEDAKRDACTGSGKPEPLKYHAPGARSRLVAHGPPDAGDQVEVDAYDVALVVVRLRGSTAR
ncbi:type II toxin-antitoxin system YoeB family toxin [Streptomyces sp. L7]